MKKIILCIDDEPIVLFTLKSSIETHFHHNVICELATNATEALEAMEELKKENKEVSLIISDWLMPGMKGDELLVNLHKNYPNIPAILLTGQADDISKTRAVEKGGALEILEKPWTASSLFSLIESILR